MLTPPPCNETPPKSQTAAATRPAHAPGMPIISVIGDGQLARMMHTEAIELGLSLRVLAGSTDSAAAQVAADVVVGDYTDFDDLHRAAAGAAVVTFDHEHVPTDHLHALCDAGVNVQPGPAALVHAQDKLVMRQKLSDIGAPVPDFAALNSIADAEEFWERVSGQVCVKARRGGYDGKGVWFPQTKTELVDLCSTLFDAGTPLMAERKLPLLRELSAMVARRPSGDIQAWPVVESVQTNGVCTLAIAPAPGLDAKAQVDIQQLAARVATELGVTGAMAVELFETRDESGQTRIFVNELAMRPHNTGHWTQDGCVTSQFEQHLRAVMDWPLGSVAPTAPVTVMANTLGAATDPDMPMPERMEKVWQKIPHAKIHLYGKPHRPGRKIGHVNVSGADGDKTRADAEAAAHFIVHATWPNGYTDETSAVNPTP